MSNYDKLLKIVSRRKKDKASRVPSNRGNVKDEDLTKFVNYMSRKRKSRGKK